MLLATGPAADLRDDFRAGATKACVACELAGCDLAGRDFKRAKLDRANLRGVNLSKCTLFRASLVRADLSAANLAGSNLNLVDAKWANLSPANLAGALLYEADLSSANLAAIQDAPRLLRGAVRWITLGYPETVGSQFLSFRQSTGKTRTSHRIISKYARRGPYTISSAPVA